MSVGESRIQYLYDVIQQKIIGLTFVFSIAVLAYLANYILTIKFNFTFSSVISIAIFFSILAANIWTIPKTFQPGIKVSLNQILYLAIILLGLRLNWSELALVGSSGLVIIMFSLLFTLTLTQWFGLRLGLNLKLVQLIACGTSICGTSAIVATNGVVKASEDDVACAVATVTAFGTIAMLLYPLLADPLHISSEEFGLWCGSSIHQTSQVIAAGFQKGTVSGELATASKLSRVLFLAPAIFCIGLSHSQNQAPGKKWSLPVPWFIIAFIGVVAINSLNIIPDNIKDFLILLDKFLIVVAMVAVGLETRLSRLRKTGIKPLILGAASWGCLSVTSLLLIKTIV